MKYKFLIILIVCCSVKIYAQQTPQYTMYMYNMNIVNPGYVIDEPGLVQVGGLFRNQWLGVDGAPETANVFANIPLNDKVEMSVNYLKDEIGDVQKDQFFNVDFAYKLFLNNNWNVSFGLKAGVNSLSLNFNDTDVYDDLLFQNSSKTMFNIGAGVFVFKNRFYAGFSSPNLIPGKIDGDNDVVYKSAQHLFFITGYVFDINEDIKLKPSTVVKQAFGAPLSFDVSVNALYQERYEFGLSYRYQDAIAAITTVDAIPSVLKLGFAYDLGIGGFSSYASDGGIEFLLIYTFDTLKFSKKYSSPRFY